MQKPKQQTGVISNNQVKLRKLSIGSAFSNLQNQTRNKNLGHLSLLFKDQKRESVHGLSAGMASNYQKNVVSLTFNNSLKWAKAYERWS
jgi:hypothetical protein